MGFSFKSKQGFIKVNFFPVLEQIVNFGMNLCNTEYLFDSKNRTNRILNNYLFPKNYLSST